MASILDIIATETHGSSFKTYMYGFDGIEVPRLIMMIINIISPGNAMVKRSHRKRLFR